MMLVPIRRVRKGSAVCESRRMMVEVCWRSLVVPTLASLCLSLGCRHAPAAGPAADWAALVDPMIGTDDDGKVFPGAVLPFGMIQWGPDTSEAEYGYLYGG